jgi:hypothetical protein
MAKANFVKKARKAIPSAGIQKGDSYYWWSFRFGGKHYSKSQPRQSQLTGSEFLSRIYSIQEQMGDLSSDLPNEELEELVRSFVDELRELAGEQEDKLNNMPDGLQQGSMVGELLQNRKIASMQRTSLRMR